MPNRLMSWNVIGGQGNHTRSIDVNNIIAKVKKNEVRKQGKPLQARCSIELEDLEEAQKIIIEEYGKDDIVRRYGIPCLVIFQFHFISRIEDSTEFLISNLSLNPDFYFTFRGRLNWSKNVREEREAPNQILIGAMNSLYFFLLKIAVYMEMFLGTGQGGLTP